MPDVVAGITVEHEMGTAQIDAPERDRRGRHRGIVDAGPPRPRIGCAFRSVSHLLA
jgi:hypothetical protein